MSSADGIIAASLTASPASARKPIRHTALAMGADSGVTGADACLSSLPHAAVAKMSEGGVDTRSSPSTQSSSASRSPDDDATRRPDAGGIARLAECDLEPAIASLSADGHAEMPKPPRGLIAAAGDERLQLPAGSHDSICASTSRVTMPVLLQYIIRRRRTAE